MMDSIKELHQYAKLTGSSFTLKFAPTTIGVESINGEEKTFKVTTYEDVASFIFNKTVEEK